MISMWPLLSIFGLGVGWLAFGWWRGDNLARAIGAGVIGLSAIFLFVMSLPL